MTMTQTDSRDTRAIELAAGGHQWLKCRAVDGSKRYGVPSQRRDGVYHLADQLTCSCYDAQRNVCKHVRAVRLWVRAVARGISVQELVAMPAAVVVDGLAQLVAGRHPVLELVRHAEGDITWERARRYSEIFDKFVGD